MTNTVFTIEDLRDICNEETNRDDPKVLEQLIEFHKFCEGSKQPSGYICWQICICFDMQGDPIEAVYWVNKAIEFDPYNVAHHNSADIIFRHVGDILTSNIRQGSAPECIQKIYDLLYQNGRVTSEIELQMARFRMKQKKFEKSAEILDKILEVNPNHADALMLKSQIEGRLKLKKVD
jgi:tetratricopeptide (TPR) repeat protein